MGVISAINGKFIKLFSFMNKDNKVCDINTYYGQKWESVKTDNETLNSIFSGVDNGDGIVQPKELNALSKVLNYIDNLFNKDEIIDAKEINEFKKQLDNGTISLEKIKNSEEKPAAAGWSEGLERNITAIQLSKAIVDGYPEVIEELKAIGEEQGFAVEEIDSGQDIWVEDLSIRRADGKIYLPAHSSPEEFLEMPQSDYASARGNKNNTNQGRMLETGAVFDLDVDAADRYFGTSYLEGGNVLNTRLKDGTPGAVVGEGSIGITLDLMGLENTPQNADKVKEQIAADLGLEPEQVTFIPQFGFHIDMSYRPMHNGEFAVPDYEQGIVILQQLRDDMNISVQKNQGEISPQIDEMQLKAEELDAKIKKLEQLAQKTKSVREEANDYLKEAGYKLVNIPCFAASDDDITNFMNGVGGTSAKTGETFYITNRPEYPELQSIIEKYFHEAGIDKVYFLSTEWALDLKGGIDCLTQEK